MAVTQQLDIFLDSTERRAAAYRRAAETELHNPHYTFAERQARHDHYLAEARRLESQHDPRTEGPTQ